MLYIIIRYHLNNYNNWHVIMTGKVLGRLNIKLCIITIYTVNLEANADTYFGVFNCSACTYT